MSGISKNSAKLKARCEYLIKAARLPHTEQRLSEDDEATDILWPDTQSSEMICPFYRIPLPEEKPRKASDIAIQEAARAVIDTSEAQYGIPRASLITETAKALGFSRVASNTDCYKLCDMAVDFAFSQGALIKDDSGFIMPSDTNN